MKIDISKIDTTPTQLQKVLKQIAYILLAGMILLTFYNYQYLPDQIPSHFSLSGEVDGYGSRSIIWMVLSLYIILNIILAFVKSNPQWINYPFKITPDNAQTRYKNMIDLTSIINVLMNSKGLALIWMMVDYQGVKDKGLTWLPEFFVFTILLLIVYYLYKGFKLS